VADIPSLELNNQQHMPLLGLGVYKATGEGEVENAVSWALEEGYRLIDTASAYKNEDGVGRAVHASSIPREELFITTKIWNNAQRIGDIDGAFKRSLERLDLDYIDLYLIHWPVPGCYLETWKQLEKLYRDGLIRSIGVSNFDMYQLEDLIANSEIVPAVNQIEIHPLWNQAELVSYCQSRGIAVQAYAPLARGAYLDRPELVEIAVNHGKSVSQVGLRWSVQKGISVIPKSAKKERIAANAEIFDFQLTDEEMRAIDGMDEKFRSASIPPDLL
jgi:diketogulonate reductase-like aldo/keto reductase